MPHTEVSRAIQRLGAQECAIGSEETIGLWMRDDKSRSGRCISSCVVIDVEYEKWSTFT